jgi:hypothetical protein
MRRILLIPALLAVLAIPATTAASAAAPGKHGFLVVRDAAGDGGVRGRPVVTVIITGFVLGRVSQEGKVDIIQLPSVNGQGAPQSTPGVSTRTIRHWHGHKHITGKEFSGSNFRFRALGGQYRVVVRGSGIYLFAGGSGKVTLRGSSVYRNADGKYSVNGGRFRSLPAPAVKRTIGRG